jgi:hypothetical protein
MDSENLGRLEFGNRYGVPSNRIHCVDYLNSSMNEVLKLARVQFRLYRPNDVCTYSMVHRLQTAL